MEPETRPKNSWISPSEISLLTFVLPSIADLRVNLAAGGGWCGDDRSVEHDNGERGFSARVSSAFRQRGSMGVYAVTGAASGMGGEVACLLREAGHSVISIDIQGGDVVADLSTRQPGIRLNALALGAVPYFRAAVGRSRWVRIGSRATCADVAFNSIAAPG